MLRDFRKNIEYKIEKNLPVDPKFAALSNSGRLHTYFQAQVALGLLEDPLFRPNLLSAMPDLPSGDTDFLPVIELQSLKRTNCQFGNDHSSKSGYSKVTTVCHKCKKQTCLTHMTYTCKKCL